MVFPTPQLQFSPPKCHQNLVPRHAMTGLQAEGVIDQAYFVCGAEGSWPSAEAHVAAALTEQWNDAANVFCLAPGTVVAYKSPGGDVVRDGW